MLLVLPLLAGLLAVSSGDDGSTGGDDPSALVDDSIVPAPPEPVSDLPTMTPEELPPEALTTLSLVAQGGPFPYERDGSTFQNREGLLPDQPEGWYREYTVETPGSPDRGARRLVVGEAFEVFYTEDHYESFRELLLT